MLEALADGVLDAGVLMRLEKTWRPAEQQSPAWIERQMSKVTAGLTAMSTGLGDKPFCAGIHFTLADVATGCVLGWRIVPLPGNRLACRSSESLEIIRQVV